MKSSLLRATAAVGVASLIQSALAAETRPLATMQPDPQADVAPYFVADTDPRWSGTDWSADDVAALRKKVKYVFVIFNENRSFDHEYGTFPGVDGLYSDGKIPRAPADTPGFTQTYQDAATGQTVTVQPFLVGPHENASFKDSTDHSHKGLAAKLDVEMRDGVPTAKMDKFAEVEWRKYAGAGSERGEKMGTQFARLVMAHMDCDTIPFFWRYASRFTIFDDIFATEDTPSTPNAIAMLAGQAGETQWVKHPSQTNQPADTGVTGAISGTINGVTYTGTATTQGPPLVNDPQPWWGSAFDDSVAGRQPTSPHEDWSPGNTASNMTFASLPLTMMGGWINLFTQWDRNPGFDLADVQKDIPAIAARDDLPVAWRWYQNGYDLEPSDAGQVASHNAYVSHHNGPQYFGYIADNAVEQMNLRGEGDFFTDISNGALPEKGGVFTIRGGYYNLDYPKQTAVIQNPNYPNPNGLTPAELAKIAKVKSGDDDHPSYSDSQLSEAMAARAINAIAGDPKLWDQSAIVIAYDESDGLYDHVPPRILSYGPDGLPLARGVRIPLILISPYARAHAVSHAEGDHNAIIETINALFGLPALSSLPDEKEALVEGNSPRFHAFAPKGFEQKYLGPRDTPSQTTASLLSGFDKARVTGALPPLPASLALIPNDVVETFPHYGGKGCAAIGVTPENVRQNIPNVIPEGFNSLPATLPDYN
jgi:phospholipase C